MKMKKNLLKIVFVSVAVLLLGVTVSWALPVFNDGEELNNNNDLYGKYLNSGSLLGVFGGNDDLNNVSEELSLLGYEFDLVFGGKTDFDNGSWEYTGDLKIEISDYDVNDDGEPLTGLWDVTSPLGAEIELYTLKGGNYFAIYLLDPAASHGSWSTWDLWQRRLNDGPGNPSDLALSHFSGFNPIAAVPEPAVLLLMGAGLFGIAAFGRRRQNKS